MLKFNGVVLQKLNSLLWIYKDILTSPKDNKIFKKDAFIVIRVIVRRATSSNLWSNFISQDIYSIYNDLYIL